MHLTTTFAQALGDLGKKDRVSRYGVINVKVKLHRQIPWFRTGSV
jgi:hypothetical protein